MNIATPFSNATEPKGPLPFFRLALQHRIYRTWAPDKEAVLTLTGEELQTLVSEQTPCPHLLVDLNFGYGIAALYNKGQSPKVSAVFVNPHGIARWLNCAARYTKAHAAIYAPWCAGGTGPWESALRAIRVDMAKRLAKQEPVGNPMTHTRDQLLLGDV